MVFVGASTVTGKSVLSPENWFLVTSLNIGFLVTSLNITNLSGLVVCCVHIAQERVALAAP